jgi:hypothetical protein
MHPAAKRSPSQIVRSRGVGAWIGTLIGIGWLVYGLRWFPEGLRFAIGLAGLGAAVALLVASRRLIASARRLPAADAAARAANRRVWTLFWVNFAVEIVLLNAAIRLLAQPALHIYWIPAISLVVGLHFLPMARFFGVPSFVACGAAMIVVAAAVAFAIRAGLDSPQLYVAGEALANAVILWVTAAWGIRAARLTLAG